MNNKKNKCLLGFAAGGLIAISCSAQAEAPLGNGESLLEVKAGALYNDNVNPTITAEDDATGWFFAPQASWDNSGEGFAVRLDYAGRYTRYDWRDDPLIGESSQSFATSDLAATGRLFLSDSWYVDGSVKVLEEDQLYGTGLSKLRSDVLVEDSLSRREGAIKLVYGSETRGRYVSLKYQNISDDYDNNLYSDEFDLDQSIVTLELGMRSSDTLRYILRAQAGDDDFDSQGRVDSKLYQVLAGVEYKPSGKSSLLALVGAYRRDFDTRDATSGANWQLAYTYRPIDDFTLRLNTNRSSVSGEDESSVDSVVSSYSANLTYRLSDWWQIGADVLSSDTEFDGELDTQDRDIDETVAGVFLRLAFASHHDLTLGWRMRDLDSSDELLGFTQNEVELSWRYAL